MMCPQSLLRMGTFVGKVIQTRHGIVRLASSSTSCRRLEGKVAMVTGSTEGIGYAIAKRLGDEGARVVISSRNQSKVDSALQSLQAEGVKHVRGIVCHVGNKEHQKALVEYTLEHEGGIDLFVPNAGMNPYIGPALETPEEVWDKVMNVDLKSVFQMTQQVVPHMKKRGGGAIVYISSIVGLNPRSDLLAYSVAKTAVLSLTKVFAAELAPSNIRVNCLAPGAIETKMMTKMWGTNKEHILRNILIKRMGESEEMAAIVAFLCSEDSSYITGEVIAAAGGVRNRL